MSLPWVEVLELLKAHLATVGENAAVPFKVRHHRFRDTDREEAPAVAIAFRGNTLRDRQGAAGDVFIEQVMELTVDLIVDVAIMPEVDPGEVEPADYDETGFSEVTAIVAECLDSLFLENNNVETFGGRVWEIEYGGEPEDPDGATPDAGTIASRLTLVYRVREDRPTTLLVN